MTEAAERKTCAEQCGGGMSRQTGGTDECEKNQTDSGTSNKAKCRHRMVELCEQSVCRVFWGCANSKRGLRRINQNSRDRDARERNCPTDIYHHIPSSEVLMCRTPLMRSPLERLPRCLRTLRGHSDSSSPSSPIVARRHCTASWDLAGPVGVGPIMIHGHHGVAERVRSCNEDVAFDDWMAA